MNLQIRIQVPKAPDAASYVHETDVQVITDPVIVHAVLATILECEAAIAGERKVERHEIGTADMTIQPDLDFDSANPLD